MAGENQNFDLDKLIKLSIIVGVFLISISIAYYLMIFIPQKERNRTELLKQEQSIKEQEDRAKERQLQANESNLDSCLDQQYERYSTLWNSTCKELGNNNDCALPAASARYIDSIRSKDEESCYKRFPIK